MRELHFEEPYGRRYLGYLYFRMIALNLVKERNLIIILSKTAWMIRLALILVKVMR